MSPTKAIALISGGLDSSLAAKLVKGLGIDVIALNFKIPFSHVEKEAPLRACGIKEPIAQKLGLPSEEIFLKEEFLEIVRNPGHGYGSNLNPCVDCKILMLRKAAGLMKQRRAKFVVTGEVLGQRPMSQHKQALGQIEKEAGLEGLVLRPLSAKLLPESIPEKEGWVNRDKLMAFSGRGRRPQMELAKDLGITDYPTPAGGCLLTDPGFSKKLKDLLNFKELTIDNIELLKCGRYFRLSSRAKLVVGRNEKENNRLVDLAKEGDYLFFPDENTAGPTSLGRGEFDDGLIRLCCGITCSYCDLNGSGEADIIYKKIPNDTQRVLRAAPIGRELIRDFSV